MNCRYGYEDGRKASHCSKLITWVGQENVDVKQSCNVGERRERALSVAGLHFGLSSHAFLEVDILRLCGKNGLLA